MKEVDNHIDELIVKSLSGGILPIEEKELADWANRTGANAIYLEELKKVWIKSRGLSTFSSVDVEGDFEIFKSKVGMGSKVAWLKVLNHSFMRVAAVLIPAIIFFAAYGLYQTTPGFGKWEAFKTTSEVESIILADQSEVFLNDNSELVFEKSFNAKQRALRLNGEGYFKVAKNPLKPFVVKVGDAEVQVLGTEFNIDENKSTGIVTLSVTEGRVLFSSVHEKIEVVAGEQAICSKGRIEKQVLKSNNSIAWMTGSIDFNKATLNEVVETIVDHFDEVNGVEDHSFETDRLITSRFNNPSLEDVLVELRIHFEKKFEINDNKLIISD